VHFTVESVRKLAATERREIPDDHCPGLYLLTLPSGVKSWVVRYRFAGQPRKLTIGKFHEKTLGLVQARKLARDAIQRVQEGHDPAAEKKAARTAAVVEAERVKTGEVVKATDNFATAWAIFEKDYMPALRPGTVSKWKGIYRRVLAPRWAKRALGEITSADIYGMMNALKAKPDAADSALTVCKVFFGWLVAEPHKIYQAHTSPVFGSTKTKRPKGQEKRNAESDRTLKAEEIRWLWKATEDDADNLADPFNCLVRTLLLTGTRRNESALMKRTESDQKAREWHIPGVRTKTGKPHTVFLSEVALDVFKAVSKVDKSKFVFAIRGGGAINGFSKRKKRLDKRMAEIAAAERGEPVKIRPWRLHGLRKTFRTGLTEWLHVPMHVAKRCTGHSLGKIDETYDKGEYVEERRAAFEAWGKHVLSLATTAPASNVVPFRADVVSLVPA
jgi:integrase